jgi:hypothetical protein
MLLEINVFDSEVVGFQTLIENLLGIEPLLKERKEDPSLSSSGFIFESLEK